MAAIINALALDKTILTRLQNWYLINCNGDWEHSYGISVNTVDNPGWTIKIDLTDTCLQNLQYEYKFDKGTFDWLFIKSSAGVFQGSGDPSKFTVILKHFLDEVIPRYSDPNFEYEVYIELVGGPTQIWRPAKARMISEELLQITNMPALKYSDIRTAHLEDITFKEEELFKYKTVFSIDDIVRVELVDTFNGTTLVAKK